MTLYVTLTGNMAAHWKFDETSGTTAADSSGNGNNGTLKNFPSSPWVSGIIGNALQFDGTNDNVMVSNSTTLQIAGDLTIAVWVYPTGFGSRRTILCKHYNNEYDLTLETDGKISFYQGDGSVEEIIEPSDMTALSNQWNHIAIRRKMNPNPVTGNKGTLDFFLNGIFMGSFTFAKTPKISTSAVYLGARTGNSYYFLGKMDDVRVYNRVLSEYAIQTLAQSSPTLSVEWADGTTTPKMWSPQVANFGDSASTTFSAVNKSSCAVDLKVSAATASGHETQKWTLSGVVGADAAMMEALAYNDEWVSLHGGNRAAAAKGLAVNAEKTFSLRFTAPLSSAETSGAFAVKLVVSPD